MSATTSADVEQLDELAAAVADLSQEMDIHHDKDLLDEAAWCIRTVAEVRRSDDE